MKIPPKPQIPVEARIDAAIAKKNLDHKKIEGEAVIKLIEGAVPGESQPLTEGPVGRTINVRV